MDKETWIGLVISATSIVLMLALHSIAITIHAFAMIGVLVLMINLIVWIVIRRRIAKRETKRREEEFKQQIYWDDDWEDYYGNDDLD